MMRILVATAVALVVIAGCSSSGRPNAGSTNSSPTNSSTTSTPQSSAPTSAPDAAGAEPCREAMVEAAVVAHGSAADATAAQQKTLTACTSRVQWLSVAAEFTSSGVAGCIVCAGAKAAEVLASFCKEAVSAPACQA